LTDVTTDLPTSAFHKKELMEESAISEAVIRERGYHTIDRPETNENFGLTLPNGRRWAHGSTREFLSFLGFPSWAIRENYFYPGLWVPQYTPRGEMYAGQWKPKNPVRNRDGKMMKYTSTKGGATRIDVHPRWSADRGDFKLPAINDPTERLWITEGVKKADSLTSRGEVTVALAGVFNWRNALGGLGDWEDVRLKDREVVICFDADAITKPAVAQAMARLGKWLKYKGAKTVWYCVVPGETHGEGVKGVDDFFAVGGSLKELERAFSKTPPKVAVSDDFFTDAKLAETLAVEILDGAYVWAAGLDWLAWNGRVWQEAHEVTVLESVRQWAVDHFAECAQELKEGKEGAVARVEGWRGLLSKARAGSVLSMARGIVQRNAADFDADPDLLNMPNGVYNFATDELMPHDPELLMTKITSGSYRPGFNHPDWDRALEVLPPGVMEWFAVRVGQAVTGHTTPDGVIPIMKGGGENGKGLLMTDGLLPAFGGYAAPASPKLFASAKNEHSTERAELRGQRLVIAEELTEGRSIDVTALKQVADIGEITARRTHKDNMRFITSHSIFATTNYTPVISETDHGTWRRLALVVFPYTYVKPGQPIRDELWERRGDPTLKARIKANRGGQHDAAVTWAIEGARRWYENTRTIEAAVNAGEEPPASVLLPPPAVAEDTLSWRKEADRILGFWEECLLPAPGFAVTAGELTERFNEWLSGNGHAPWAKETFRPRFKDHGETKAHRVLFKRKTRVSALRMVVDRKPLPPGFHHAHKALPGQIDAWTGVKFRQAEDDS
jgi:putative DNA primase/helicase